MAGYFRVRYKGKIWKLIGEFLVTSVGEALQLQLVGIKCASVDNDKAVF